MRVFINQCIYHLERNKLCKWQHLHEAKKTVFKVLKKKCEITKICCTNFCNQKRNVTLAGNAALLNKRVQCTLDDQKKDRNVNLFVLNVQNMYVLNTGSLSATTMLSYNYFYCYYYNFRFSSSIAILAWWRGLRFV